MILPEVRDRRFVRIRRGGTLTDSDHHLLALWAASCAEHVLHLFESAQPDDSRPREAIGHARAWVRGEVTMMQARAAGGHAMGAARNLRGAARHAAYAAGQAGVVAHVAAHELGAAAYAIKAARASAPEGESEVAGRLECQWQRDQRALLDSALTGPLDARVRELIVAETGEPAGVATSPHTPTGRCWPRPAPPAWGPAGPPRRRSRCAGTGQAAAPAAVPTPCAAKTARRRRRVRSPQDSL
jgi:hypothetical protein